MVARNLVGGDIPIWWRPVERFLGALAEVG